MKKILEITHHENQPRKEPLAYGTTDISVDDQIKIEFIKGEQGTAHQIELVLKSSINSDVFTINAAGSGGMVKEGRVRDFIDKGSPAIIRTSLAYLSCAPGLNGLKVTFFRN